MEWFRFYSEVLDDPKVQRLPGALFKSWVNLLCLANKGRCRGVLPPLADVAFALRVSEAAARALLRQLTEYELIAVLPDGRLAPHNWDGRQHPSDDAAGRKRDYRARLSQSPDPPPDGDSARDMSQDSARDTDGTSPVLEREEIRIDTETEEKRVEGEIITAPAARARAPAREAHPVPKHKAAAAVPGWGYPEYFALREAAFRYPLAKSQYSGETAAVNEVLADYPEVTPADLVAFLAYRRTCFGVDQASALLLVRCKEHFGAWWAAGRPATQVQNGGTHANDRPTFPTADERRSDSFAAWADLARNGSAPGDDPGPSGPDLRLIRAGPAEPAD